MLAITGLAITMKKTCLWMKLV